MINRGIASAHQIWQVTLSMGIALKICRHRIMTLKINPLLWVKTLNFWIISKWVCRPSVISNKITLLIKIAIVKTRVVCKISIRMTSSRRNWTQVLTTMAWEWRRNWKLLHPLINPRRVLTSNPLPIKNQGGTRIKTGKGVVVQAQIHPILIEIAWINQLITSVMEAITVTTEGTWQVIPMKMKTKTITVRTIETTLIMMINTMMRRRMIVNLRSQVTMMLMKHSRCKKWGIYRGTRIIITLLVMGILIIMAIWI